MFFRKMSDFGEDFEQWKMSILQTFNTPENNYDSIAKQCLTTIGKIQRDGILTVLKTSNLPDVDLSLLRRLNTTFNNGILSLPFSLISFNLILSLIKEDFSLKIISTPLTRQYLQTFEQIKNEKVKFFSSLEMIKDYRENNNKAIKTIYITFPDHHMTGRETMVISQFFGKDFYFSAIESALLNLGVTNIFSLSAELKNSEMVFFLKYYHLPTSSKRNSFSTKVEIQQLIKWISEGLEEYFLLAPETILSWNQIYLRSCDWQNKMKVTEIKFIECLIKEWYFTNKESDEKIYNWSMNRLYNLKKDTEETSIFQF